MVCQPQREKFSGNALSGRTAISLEMKSDDEPMFDSIWFDDMTNTDKNANNATIHELNVTKGRGLYDDSAGKSVLPPYQRIIKPMPVARHDESDATS